VTRLAYRDGDGVGHELIVRRTSTGDWQVLDSSPGETFLVETLDGSVDDRAQADAVARDYLVRGRLLGWAGSPAGEAIPEQGRC
jgi:hypothetical protein